MITGRHKKSCAKHKKISIDTVDPRHHNRDMETNTALNTNDRTRKETPMPLTHTIVSIVRILAVDLDDEMIADLLAAGNVFRVGGLECIAKMYSNDHCFPQTSRMNDEQWNTLDGAIRYLRQTEAAVGCIVTTLDDCGHEVRFALHKADLR
jgi:hypothetical protein